MLSARQSFVFIAEQFPVMWMGATLSLSVDQWMDLWLIPTFWLLWTWVCPSLSGARFQFLGVCSWGRLLVSSSICVCKSAKTSALSRFSHQMFYFNSLIDLNILNTP